MLATPLTDLERAFIDRRIAEELAEVRRMNGLRRQAVGNAAKRPVPVSIEGNRQGWTFPS
jgi:hypothetical protein